MNPLKLDHAAQCFIAAGVGLTVGALAHIAAIVGGPEVIAFMGAPESIVQSARDKTWLAPVATCAIAALLFVWAWYAFAAANLVKKLPFTRAVLVFVAVVFILRGLTAVPAFFAVGVKFSSPSTQFSLASSGYVLVLGVLLAVGLWRTRQKPNPQQTD
jgi:small-conductance mechanosensitive channel